MNRRPHYALLALAAAASCGGPKVSSFMLEPRNVCRGEDTHVSWAVSGTPTLRVRYGRARTDEPDEPDTVSFLLIVAKGRDTVTQHEDLLQFPARFAHTIAIAAAPEQSDVVAAGETNPAQWPPAFVIHSVKSGSGRAITVEHAGRSATLAADGAETLALQGTPLAGSWHLRSPLAPGSEPPNRLRLLLTVNCVS